MIEMKINTQKVGGIITILIGVILGSMYILNTIQAGSMELAGMDKWTGVFVVQVMFCFFLGYMQYSFADM
jgi:hypothetical protein